MEYKKTYPGHTDVPLNATGKKQARMIAKDLKDIHIDVIYTSPLSRAYETAKIINAHHHTKIIKDDALRERRFGELEGKTYEEVNASHPALIFSETWNYPNYHPPGGESVSEVRKRVTLSAKRMLQAHKGKSILIVSHGDALRILMGSFLGTPPELFRRLRMNNAALTILEIAKGAPTLHVINYQSVKS